jgi:hypothetical protein
MYRKMDGPGNHYVDKQVKLNKAQYPTLLLICRTYVYEDDKGTLMWKGEVLWNQQEGGKGKERMLRREKDWNKLCVYIAVQHNETHQHWKKGGERGMGI